MSGPEENLEEGWRSIGERIEIEPPTPLGLYLGCDRKRFVDGFFTTLKLASSCVVLSVVIGIAGAWLQGSRLHLTRRIVYWYIQFFRNTPPLVQLYFFYFGVGHWITGPGNVPLVSNIQWALFALSLWIFSRLGASKAEGEEP